MGQLRRYGRIVALLTLVFLAAGCAARGGDTGGKPRGQRAAEVLRVAFTREPTTLDPAKAKTLEERLLLQALYAGLVAYDPESRKLVPALAERWERSSDGLVYTFHLRRAKFFGGRPITAADVKYALSRLVNPAVASPWANLLANVAGAAAYAQGAAPEIEGLKVLDDLTLQIVLLQPQDDFLFSLAHPAAAVVDRLSLESAGTAFARPGTWTASLVTAGGSGPYSAVEWAKGRFLVLEANHNYYAGRPATERLEVYFTDLESAYLDFLAGRVDLVVGLDAAHLSEVGTDNYLTSRLRYFPLDGAVFLAWSASSVPPEVASAAAGLDRADLAAGGEGLLEPLFLPTATVTPPSAIPETVRPKQILELLYPEAGLGLWFSATDTRLLARRLAQQLAATSRLAVQERAVPAPQVEGLVLAASLAPYAGAPWSKPEGASTVVLPLFRPRLAVLLGEGVEGFALSPYGDLAWARVRLGSRIAPLQETNN